jgi:YhcH/YjgK/YiaL family protein
MSIYGGIKSDLSRAFVFLKKLGYENKTPGRYSLAGDTYYMVQSYDTRSESTGFFESHRQFIDIQFMVSGSERVDYAPASALTLRGDYNKEKDLQIYDGKGDTFILRPGFFAVFFPQDAHMPCLWVNKSKPVIKVVVKVPV